MTADEVFDIARDAVKRMAAEKEANFLFSYDQIWDFAPKGASVSSAQRPGPTRRLIREGYIKKTDRMRNAASQARAGSPTREYSFGRTLVGDRSGPSQTRLLNVLKDGRTGCFSLLATMSVEEYLNFVENAYYERDGGVEGQRTPLRTNTAIRIRKTMVSDLEAGAILPPVVVGLVMPGPFLTAADSNMTDRGLQNLLDGVPEENISVIDGMQRTAALIQLRSDPNVLKKTMRVEFWLAGNTNSLIYRMLVLNTGQVPWDLRRQIEVIHKSLIKELRERVSSIEVLEKDDLRRRVRPGQFQADRIVELYMVFGARKEKIDTKERLADEFTRLDFIEATSVSLFTVQFFEVLELLAKFDRVFDKYEGDEVEDRFTGGRDLFSSQPACVGFVAAVAIDVFGRPGGVERSQQQHQANLEKIKAQADQLVSHLGNFSSDQIGSFLDLATLNEVVVNKKVGKVGDFQREFFLKAFQTLIDENFLVEAMTPCWRAF